MTFTLHGQMPSGKNQMHITRTGHRYPNARFVTWREDAMQQLHRQSQEHAQEGLCLPLSSTISLFVTYTPGDARTRDVSGMLDALFHVIVKAGLLADDGLVWGVTWRREAMDRQNPKLVFTMEVQP